MKDNEIIECLRSSSQEKRNLAAKVLLEKNFARLCKISAPHSNSPAETEAKAKELFRDAFTAMYRALKNPEWVLHSGKLSTYFYSIAHRIQSQKKNKSSYVYGEISPRQQRKMAHWHQEALAKDEKTRVLQNAIARLDPRCQELIKAHYYSGCTWKDIAKEEMKAPATIRQQASRCLQKLRVVYSNSVKVIT